MSDLSITLLQSLDLMENAERTRNTDSSDAALLERFQEGENAALVELFDRHNRRLFVYAYKILGSEEPARDVTQELWVRVLGLRRRPRRIDNPVGFFLRVVRNLCMDSLGARRNHGDIDTIPESAHPRDDGPDELAERILDALDHLPFDQREVLILHNYCGYAMDEIAEMLGTSPQAIWKRASRARGRMREELGARS
jgi:RNA polymerase sigma factor (sigma-70 family)